jgi:hypothetical protein
VQVQFLNSYRRKPGRDVGGGAENVYGISLVVYQISRNAAFIPEMLILCCCIYAFS